MTRLRTTFLLLLPLLAVTGCESTGDTPSEPRIVPMTLAILRSGGSLDVDEATRLEMLDGHHQRRVEMGQAGHLVLAGPFDSSRDMADPSLRGLYVFDTGDLDQARLWAKSDPAVAGGMFRVDLLAMEAPAALRRVNDLHVEMVERLPPEQQGNMAAGIAQFSVAFGRIPTARFPADLDESDLLVHARLDDGRDLAVFDVVDQKSLTARLGNRFAVHPWATSQVLRHIGQASGADGD